MMINLSIKRFNVVSVNDLAHIGTIILGVCVVIGILLVGLSIRLISTNGNWSMSIDGPMFVAGLIIAVVGAFAGTLIARNS
jgi:hypothetical protein